MNSSEALRRGPATPGPQLGGHAPAAEMTLDSHRLGLLPVLDHLLQRLRLEEFLRAYLPPDKRRCRISPARGLMVLLKNLLLSREPLYGVGEWAAGYEPDALGLSEEQVAALNDDCVGRCLDRLFHSDCGSLVLAVGAHAVREFAVRLDELHNDSTTITFFDDYADAATAEDAAEAAWDTGRAASRAAAQGDLQRLLALELGRPGILGKPIDPAQEGPLGPLWPGGTPAWYTHPPTPRDEPTPPAPSLDD